MREYRFARRAKTIAGFAARVRREKSVDGVSRLCGEMFRRFGGPVGFASVWKTHLDAATPGSGMALRSLAALFRLGEMADAKQQPEDLSRLTDAELERDIDAGIRRVFGAEIERRLGEQIQGLAGACT
jgi:hypothetical protein